VSEGKTSLEVASIKQFCRRLHMPTIAGQCLRLAEQAIKEKRSHLAFLDALLEAEVEEREKNVVARRMKDAHFPKVKTLEEIDFETASHLPAARLRKLAEGDYLIRTEPVIFLGDTGTGKTHLATALAVAACQQRKRVRFTTAAELINELIEAREKNEVSRAAGRWMRYELIVLDELCYVAMPESAAELLFQVVAGRAERAGVIVTTNLPFSEWTTMIPNARLCKAMVDRLTDQAHIIETGTESYRFRRTMAKNKGARA
jgi:DNA replication protein DnaC